MNGEQTPFYRRAGKKLRQGDIALAEFVELRSPHDVSGPGPAAVSDDSLPYLGGYNDFELDLSADESKHEYRILRVWKGPVIVLHQACELDWASSNDSRLIVAPIVLESDWPGDHWDRAIRRNLSPGYFHLPAAAPEIAAQIGQKRPAPLPSSAVSFASTCLVGRKIVEPRRYASLASSALPPFQSAISRFFTIRGYQDLRDLAYLTGKRVVAVEDTGHFVDGPSLVVKVFFGDNDAETDDADDEASFAYFGVRRSAPRPGVPKADAVTSIRRESEDPTGGA
jgi:hypothetical protein